MTQLIGYSPEFSAPHRTDSNTLLITAGSVIITITTPQNDDRALIVAELIKASPDLWRALRGVESYAETVRPTQAALDQCKDFATAALENVPQLEKANNQ